MAEYTNLTSLQGLSVGDIITYDTTTAIDFKGYKVKVELHGMNSYKEGTSAGLPVSRSATGGLTTAIVDSSKTASKIFTVVYGTNTRTGRCDLCYGNTSDLYYRILTVGFASAPSGTSGDANAGKNGGGESGGSVGGYKNGKAGKQTSGGAGGGISVLGYAGDGGFGYGGTKKGDTTSDGSYGWYGGGGGYSASGGSGSGFVIGVTTTTYPSGYLGDDTSLQENIAAAITEGSTTSGGATKSTATAPAIILTIIEVGETGSSKSVIQYYNGTDFIDTNAKYYNGSKFIDCDAYYYDGTEFIKI